MHGGVRVSARTEDARALKPRVELTSGSHNGEDQEWIHGCRSVAGWVVESLYTSQGDGGGVPVRVGGVATPPSANTPTAFPFPGSCISSAMFGHNAGLYLQVIRTGRPADS